MDRSGSTTLIAQAPQQEMPEPAPLAVDRVEKSAPAPETPAAKTAAPNSDSQPSPIDQLKSKDAIRDASPNGSLAKNSSDEKKEAAPLASGNKAKTLAAPPPSVAPVMPPQAAVSSAMNSVAPLPQAQARIDSAPAAAPVPAAPNPAAAGAARSEGQTATATQVAPLNGERSHSVLGTLPQPESDLPLNGRNYQALTRLRPAPFLLLKSATGTAFWRVGVAGLIERSVDEGKTWSPQVSPSQEDWLAGSAVSDAVAWLAGRNGAIARTTDGKDWQSLSSPSQASVKDSKLPDWAGITAQNAESAVITAADGSKFATTDGGKTWHRQP
jgi:hypothetical protein